MRGMNAGGSFIPLSSPSAEPCVRVCEPTRVVHLWRQIPLVVQDTANASGQARRRCLPPPTTRAHSRNVDRGVSDPTPGACWPPRARPKGSLTPHVSMSLPRAMCRNRVRKLGAASASFAWPKPPGRERAGREAQTFCKVSAAACVHLSRAR